MRGISSSTTKPINTIQDIYVQTGTSTDLEEARITEEEGKDLLLEKQSEEVIKVRKPNIDYWQRFTNDKWILDTDRGYKIDFFFKETKELFIPKMISFIDSDSVLVQNEVELWFAKVAIEQLDSPSDEFISIKKKDGTQRSIIN